MCTGCPGGMYLLQRLPEGVPKPEGFVQGSRAMLEEVTTKMIATYQSDAGKSVVEEWVNFRDNIAPQSDSVTEHIKLHPEHWHIPLREQLFGGAACVHGEDIPSRARKSRSSTGKVPGRERESRQLDYVKWGRRGVAQKDCRAKHFPNVVVRGPPDVKYSVPVYCRSKPEKKSTAPKKRGRKAVPQPPLVDDSDGIIIIIYIINILSI